MNRQQAADWIHFNVRPPASGEQQGLEQSDLEDVLDYAMVNGRSFIGPYEVSWNTNNGYSFREDAAKGAG